MANSDAFYLEVRDEVDSVLQEFGTTYQVRGQGTYDPDTLSNSPAAAPREVVGLVADQAVELLPGVVDSAKQWTGKKTLILGANAAPGPTEEIQVDGQWFPLSKVVEIKPADVTVVYLLDVTR